VFGPELQEVQQEASERLAAAERKVGAVGASLFDSRHVFCAAGCGRLVRGGCWHCCVVCCYTYVRQLVVLGWLLGVCCSADGWSGAAGDTVRGE
jgi:hypothetical protein